MDINDLLGRARANARHKPKATKATKATKGQEPQTTRLIGFDPKPIANTAFRMVKANQAELLSYKRYNGAKV